MAPRKPRPAPAPKPVPAHPDITAHPHFLAVSAERDALAVDRARLAERLQRFGEDPAPGGSGSICRSCMRPATTRHGFCAGCAAHRELLADRAPDLQKLVLQAVEGKVCPWCGHEGKPDQAPHEGNRDECPATIALGLTPLPSAG